MHLVPCFGEFSCAMHAMICDDYGGALIVWIRSAGPRSGSLSEFFVQVGWVGNRHLGAHCTISGRWHLTSSVVDCGFV